MQFLRNWMRFIRAVVRICPWPALLTALVTVVSGLQTAAEFWAVQGLINYVVQHLGAGFQWQAVAGWLAVLAVVALAGEMARGTQPFLYEWLRQDSELVLEGQLLDRAGRAPLLMLETPAFFDRYSRARDGLRRNVYDVIELTQSIATGLIAVVSVLAVLAVTHWGAMLAILVGAVPVFIMRQKVGETWVELFRGQTEQQRQAAYLSDLMTQRRAAQEIRLFGLAGDLLGRWRRVATGIMRERIGMTDKAARTDTLAGVVGAASFAGAVVLLGLSAMGGGLSVGAFAAAVKAAQDLQGSLGELVWHFGSLRRTAGFAGDFWDFLDSLPGAEQAPDEAILVGDGTPVPVVCENVSFAYPGAGRPSLQDVTFRVEPGELIALVGENGAGKSTLVKVLMGLYPPTAGAVAVDGAAPASPEGAPVRTRMASVFQDFVRYSIAAGENVGVGEAPAVSDRTRIEVAATGSGASAVIEALPHGYDTILGKQWAGGEELSGGQWQKVAIARGYMRRASLLVLDEPTAALDPLAELEVFRRFQALVKGRTAFLISHRLGAARLADRVFVMKDGRLVEAGGHDELMARDGEYAALFRAQAGWYQ
jgi:ATP-binding cassette, subfamily B, bacterial